MWKKLTVWFSNVCLQRLIISIISSPDDDGDIHLKDTQSLVTVISLLAQHLEPDGQQVIKKLTFGRLCVVPYPIKQLNYPFSVLPQFRSLFSAFFSSHLSFSRSGCLHPSPDLLTSFTFIFPSLHSYRPGYTEYAQTTTLVRNIISFSSFLWSRSCFKWPVWLLCIPSWVIWFMCFIWFVWIPWLL